MLSSFPQLAQSEFHEACNQLLRVYQERGIVGQADWTSVEGVLQHEIRYLKITTELSTSLNASASVADDGGAEEIEEDDEEVLSAPSKSHASVDYDILLSPTYRVPVLYFYVSDALHRYPTTMTTLYDFLIPSQYKAQTENVGVIGGVTITDHPVTNRPVFFIHPCQTAQVMEASACAGDITAYEYLLIWIGALGKCVGLNVPLAFAKEHQRHMQ
jgi:ubiquitin-like-conjugating enzyme ATG10